MGCGKNKQKDDTSPWSSKKIQDPKYMGEPMEDKYHEGPDEARSCTDVFCCMLFVVFVCGMGVAAYFGLERGDPYRLFCPYNSFAVQCGFKNETVDTTTMTFVYFPGAITNLLHLSTIIDSICISSCPAENDDLSTFDCYSNVGGKCNTIIAGNPTTPTYGTTGLFNRFCIPGDSNSGSSVNMIASNLIGVIGEDKIGRYMSDLLQAWKVLLISVGFAFVLCMLYLVILRCIASLLIWLTIIAVELGLDALGAFLFLKYQKANPNVGYDRKMYYGLAISVWIIAGIYLIMLMFLGHRIQQAVRIIKEAARYVQEKPSTLLLPIVMFVFAMIFFAYWVIVAVLSLIHI